MNHPRIFTFLFALLLLSSCGGEKIDRPTPVLTPEQLQASQNTFDSPTVPSGGVATGGVKHYTCPNGHEGSDSQGSCIVCGATLQHNQAWHNQPAQTPQTPTPGGEPPQNAAGVWHYICPSGHDGGAGSAVACAECGTTLIHNTAYHDQAGATSPVAGASSEASRWLSCRLSPIM